MAKRIGLIALVIVAFGVFDYFCAQLSNSFAATTNGPSPSVSASSPSLFDLPIGPGSGVGGLSAGISNGLSQVDFSLFSQNGKGWSYITQGYGKTPYSSWYVNGWHNGVDIGANYGAPIYSPRAGTVIATGNQDNYCPGRGFGKFVAVSDPQDNVFLWYAHLGTIDVKPGEAVSQGTELATIGDTGLETGPHLHFSVFEAAGFSIEDKNGCGPDANGHDVNPIPYLEKFGQ